MRYRQLGRSGLTISVLGLGTRSFGRTCDEQNATAVVNAAIDAGVTFIDTAASYADGVSETILGRILKGKRDQVVLGTKFGGPRAVRPEIALGSRRYIRTAVEESLQRLQTDYIDLYMQHVPDDRTPIEETLGALDELIREGKVLYAGSSNFEAWQVVEAEWAARANGITRFISAQNQYSLVLRGIEKDLVPVCTRYDIGVLPWRPLGAGLLTSAGDAAREALPAADRERVERMEAFGKARGVGVLEVAIGGLAAMPGVTCVMTGAERPGEIEANAVASEWVPSEADLAELKEITV